MTFGSKKAIFGVIWGGVKGFGPCLGISQSTHPHLGKSFFMPSLIPDLIFIFLLALTGALNAMVHQNIKYIQKIGQFLRFWAFRHSYILHVARVTQDFFDTQYLPFCKDNWENRHFCFRNVFLLAPSGAPVLILVYYIPAAPTFHFFQILSNAELQCTYRTRQYFCMN